MTQSPNDFIRVLTIFPQAFRRVKWNEARVFVGYVMACAFFVYAAVVPLFNYPKTAMSPDELSNRFFAGLVSREGSLWYGESLNALAFDRIHARGFESHAGLVSHSVFWGMSLIVGNLQRVLGVVDMVWLAPFLAIAASLMIGRGMQHYVSRETAWLLAALFLLMPGVVYFSFRGWHHAVLFISLLIGIWFFGFTHVFTNSKFTRERRALEYIFAGACVIIAVLVRPIELVWLLPLFGCIAWKISRSFGIYLASVAAVTGCVVGVMSWILRNPGVNVTQFSAVAEPLTSLATHSFIDLLHTRVLYGPVMNPLLFLLAGIGVATILYYYFYKKIREGMIVYFCGALVMIAMVNVVQMFTYGFFAIDDSGLGIATVSNSYVRYWLPSFALLLVPAGVGIETLKDRFPKYFFYGASAMIVLATILCYRTTMRGPDGIPEMHARQLRYDIVAEKMFAIIPESAVVVTIKADKLLFPARRVMVEPLGSQGLRESVSALLDAHVPVYIVIAADEITQLAVFPFLVEAPTVVDEFTMYEVSAR